MPNNTMSRKLFKYFVVSFLLFSLIMGSVFMILFRNNAVKIHKEEMLSQARRISETMGPIMGTQGQKMGYGAYLRLMGDITGADVWIVDQHYNILTTGNHHGMGHKTSVEYKELPPNAETIISQVLQDKEVFSGEFSSLFASSTLTLGIPIKGPGDTILGGVLLHSPVDVTQETIYGGLWMLLISMVFALILSFLLALWLSKKFTDPILIKEAEDIIKTDQIRKDFIANISHELRTPITVIKGSVEALMDGVITEKPKIDEYHHQIFSEANYLQGMVGELLDLSKLQNPDFPMERETLNFREVVSDGVRSANAIGRPRKIQVIGHYEEDILPLEGDYGRLRQMVLILLENAVKFSPEESLVEVNLSKDLLSITDYGKGISQEELPHIFEKFYKTREESNQVGTGLGLAIAQQIAQRHQMEITVDSQEGKKTTFFIKKTWNKKNKNTFSS